MSFVLTRQSFSQLFLFVLSLIRLFQRVLFSFLSSLSFLNFHIFFYLFLLNMKAASLFSPASLSYILTEHPFFFVSSLFYMQVSLLTSSLTSLLPHSPPSLHSTFSFFFHSCSYDRFTHLKILSPCTMRTHSSRAITNVGMIPEAHRYSTRRS